jgi:uncharacterized protein
VDDVGKEVPVGTRTVTTRPAAVKVTYRRVKFAFEETGFDRYWHGGSAFKSLFWDQLSAAFGPGEKFFIDSARALDGEIRDPALRDELREFCRQEGHHTLQHQKLDRENEELGVDVALCRARYARVLDRVRAHAEPLDMLAVTVALEHFTAGAAEQYFAQPQVGGGADPNVRALWEWHAAEEIEHKGTCFDIYRAAGGGYLRRITVVSSAWLLILGLSLWNTFTLLRKDGQLGNLRDMRAGLAYLFGRRGMITGMLPGFFAYFRPAFHPWQHDSSAVIAAWKAKSAQYVVHGVARSASSAPRVESAA